MVGDSHPMFEIPALIDTVNQRFQKRQLMHRFLLQADNVRCIPRAGKFCAGWALALLFLLNVAIPKATGFNTEIGFNALTDALGDDLPDGSGVVVSQVEASAGSENGPYMPDLEDPEVDGKTIINGSNTNSDYSSHARGVAQRFYGNITSLTPGITDITVYEAGNYLENILKVNKTAGPTAQEFKVQNHSWIGTYTNHNDNPIPTTIRQALRRFDFTIDNQEMIVAAGLNNGSFTEIPYLFSHSYNAISVGRTDGDHSTGETILANYNSGRQKPDIVAPEVNTSYSTSVVSSAAALLYNSGSGTNSILTEPIKAILMAGATKDEFSGWAHTPTSPLDETFGAGELNILNSYKIQLGGEFEGSTSSPAAPVGDYGWDYDVAEPGQALLYNFEVPEFNTGAELSVLLAWNITITDTNPGHPFSPTDSLANLDLQLFNSTDTYLGELVDSSVSTIDNVEHIYLTDLDPGTYTLRLTTSATHDFGLAWRLSNIAPGVSFGDYNNNGTVDAADFTIWQDTLGSLLDLRADGDGNGVIGQADYLVWETGFGMLVPASAAAVSSATMAIPEPESLTLCLVILILLARWLAPRGLSHGMPRSRIA
jgi:hypothetical protein